MGLLWRCLAGFNAPIIAASVRASFHASEALPLMVQPGDLQAVEPQILSLGGAIQVTNYSTIIMPYYVDSNAIPKIPTPLRGDESIAYLADTLGRELSANVTATRDGTNGKATFALEGILPYEGGSREPAALHLCTSGVPWRITRLGMITPRPDYPGLASNGKEFETVASFEAENPTDPDYWVLRREQPRGSGTQKSVATARTRSSATQYQSLCSHCPNWKP